MFSTLALPKPSQYNMEHCLSDNRKLRVQRVTAYSFWCSLDYQSSTADTNSAVFFHLLNQAIFCPLFWRPVKAGGLRYIEFWRKKCEFFRQKCQFFLIRSFFFQLSSKERPAVLWVLKAKVNFFLKPCSIWVFSKVDKKAMLDDLLRRKFDCCIKMNKIA